MKTTQTKTKSTTTSTNSSSLGLDRVLTSKSKVILSDQVWSLARYLCQRFSDIEWFAIVFYRIEGSLDDMAKAVFHVDYMYPMDLGDGGSTSIENHEEILDVYDAHPELEDPKYRQGVMHSHNSMEVWFSSTDVKQLVDGAKEFSLFLSLITNNAGEITGRISFPYQKTSVWTYLGLSTQSDSGERVGYGELDVSVPEVSFTDEMILKRVDQLEEENKKPLWSRYGGHGSSGGGLRHYGYGGGTDLFTPPKDNGHKKPPEDPAGKQLSKADVPIFTGQRACMAASWVLRAITEALGTLVALRVCHTQGELIGEIVDAFNASMGSKKIIGKAKVPDSIYPEIFLELDKCAYTAADYLNGIRLLVLIMNDDIDFSDAGKKPLRAWDIILQGLLDRYIKRYKEQ